MAMHECWIGDNLLTFDGRVVELFGHPATPSARYHVENLRLEFHDENRKGDRHLELGAATKRSGAIMVTVPAADRAQVEPVVDAILAAMPE